MHTFAPKVYNGWPNALKTVAMPAFKLKVVSIPNDSKRLKQTVPFFKDKSDFQVQKAMQQLRTQRNVHAGLLWDPSTNFRRQKTLVRFKKAVMFTGDPSEIYHSVEHKSNLLFYIFRV